MLPTRLSLGHLGQSERTKISKISKSRKWFLVNEDGNSIINGR